MTLLTTPIGLTQIKIYHHLNPSVLPKAQHYQQPWIKTTKDKERVKVRDKESMEERPNEAIEL